MKLYLLGYGRAGEIAAIKNVRRRTPEPRQVTRAEVTRFEAFARMLSVKYAYHGSGADEEDIEQEALVAAWLALEQFDGRRGVEAFVKERMRYRVIDFVRIRGNGQRALERRVAPLREEDG